MMLLSGAVVPGAARAQKTADHEVLAAVDSLFAGMKRRDVAALRAILLPGAALYATVTGGPSAPRVQADSTFLRSIGAAQGELLERYWTPTVLVSGDVASVWAPYDFHNGGTFSHCGIDVFSLLKGATGWRITSITYTIQRNECAPSPLGPPAK